MFSAVSFKALRFLTWAGLQVCSDSTKENAAYYFPPEQWADPHLALATHRRTLRQRAQIHVAVQVEACAVHKLEHSEREVVVLPQAIAHDLHRAVFDVRTAAQKREKTSDEVFASHNVEPTAGYPPMMRSYLIVSLGIGCCVTQQDSVTILTMFPSSPSALSWIQTCWLRSNSVSDSSSCVRPLSE